MEGVKLGRATPPPLLWPAAMRRMRQPTSLATNQGFPRTFGGSRVRLVRCDLRGPCAAPIRVRVSRGVVRLVENGPHSRGWAIVMCTVVNIDLATPHFSHNIHDSPTYRPGPAWGQDPARQTITSRHVAGLPSFIHLFFGMMNW